MTMPPRHRHNWDRVGGPPDEPWDSNVYLQCVTCRKTKEYPCVILWCSLPIGHDGTHRPFASRHLAR